MSEPQADYVCQIYVTASQAALLVACMNEALNDAAMPIPAIHAIEDLCKFLADVAERPTAYPVRGQMARTLKTRYRRMKGPEQSKRERARSQRRRAEEAARRAKGTYPRGNDGSDGLEDGHWESEGGALAPE